MSEKELVHYEVDDKVCVLTLDDPPANTYTYEMMRQLDEVVLRARMDNDVEVIVLTGAGEKFFSAGANISMLNEAEPTFKYYFCLHANETLNRLEHTPKLTIAALNGHTVGGGFEIAMAADLRIARKGAGKIGLPEVTLGVLPGTGGTQRLCRLVGKSQAIELMAGGDVFDLADGLDRNMVNQVLEADSHEDFMGQVMAYAKTFTTPNKASKAVGHIKRAVQTGIGLPFEQALTLERELQQQLFQSQDAREGISAYVEKRKAKFTGK
jgi:enoyl-CoA hydratase/carnithine racemase